MQNREKMKEAVKGNVLFHALPYAIFISCFTILGLFGGFVLGNMLGGSTLGFVFSISLTFLGFFLGLFIAYHIVKEKYPIC
ncbi:hypothetical protein C4E22_06255 [ANME-1 cluster archaeon AG-394-G06]|nr:hypothetical protein [ANME-1 cluster archaeon AG-394-G06]